jgi:hypothetical protein
MPAIRSCAAATTAAMYSSTAARSSGTCGGYRLAPCSGTPARTRGWSAGRSVPKYRPSLRSGAPDVSSPNTGKYPRHAGPPRAIATSSLLASGSPKNLALAAVSRARSSGATPWPTT